MVRVVGFLKSVLAEIKHISWASRREVAGFTIVVLILVFLVSFFILFVDFVISWLVGLVV